jgi:RNA polymerase sigma factor (sigma-70 family)
VGRASDAELIEASLVDAGRFGEVFDRHAPAILRFLDRRTGPDDAGDLLGEVFLAAFEARGRYDRGRPSALPWLYGIAANRLGTHHRNRAAERRALARLPDRGDPGDHADAVTAAVDAQVALRALADVLGRLPDVERDALRLYAWEGLTYREVGEVLGVPTGTVRSRLGRVRRRVRADVFDRERERLMRAIHEGKTKVVIDAGDGTVLIRSKDAITAGDGERRDVIAGKAAASTTTTTNVFRLLADHGVPTHFVAPVDAVTFRARRMEMVPVELVVRRIATGSYLDRHPDVADGTVLADLVFEVFEKDDAAHDPLVEVDGDRLRRFVPNARAAARLGLRPGDLMGEEPLARSRLAVLTPDLLSQLRELALRTFVVVEQAWAGLGGTYVDVKVECGVDPRTGEVVVADVIDSDSGRLRFGDRDVSKQSYRDGTLSPAEVGATFDEVAALTAQLV